MHAMFPNIGSKEGELPHCPAINNNWLFLYYYTCQKKWLITHAKKSGIIIITHAQKEGQYW